MGVRAMALLSILLLGGTASLPGQRGGRRIRVQGARSLTFGTLLPGVPQPISRTDPLRSGQFLFTGARFSQVQLTLALPVALNGPAGATLPVTFGSNDAGYSASQSITSQIGFDPRAPFLATLGGNGRGSVFLGGTARPLTSQRAGSYSGTVTLTVVYFP